ncbi:MAG: Gfo/Idh/MocA family oxidoreductase [Bacteroidetes bacterium]|nr:Gfo/Idh/MocA family oxidoreductase [Bacteroidota bacterium]MCL6103701.1 Gfo/Idh/MocA family oxidoreductase [Bacteroidota bacterium]
MNDKRNFSRRNFIGIGGVASAGLALSSSQLIARPLFAGDSNSSKKYKIGIVGCGNRSKTIIGALNSVPDIEIAALCDIVEHKMGQRAELIKNGPKPQFYADMQQMFKRDDIDAIAIITPNYTHKEYVIAALEAGKNVFCEKPMALTVADCNLMIDAVKRTKKSLQIGTQRRHSVDYKKLVEVIRTKQVGKILYSDLFDYRGDWRVPEPDEYPKGVGYWRMDQSKSGGVVYEMGAHIIDVNNWVFDSEPLSVSSIQGVNNPSLRKRDSMDHAGVLVRYANDALMNYGSNVYNYGAAAADTFFGINGSVQMGSGKISIKYGKPNGVPFQGEILKPELITLPGGNPEGEGVIQELKHFALVLAGKEKAYPDGNIARQTVQICEASVRSAKERRQIDVKELG